MLQWKNKLENKTSFIHKFLLKKKTQKTFNGMAVGITHGGAIKVIKKDIEWNLRFSETYEGTSWSCTYDTAIHNTCVCLKQKRRTSKVAKEHLNGTGFLHLQNWILSRLSQSSFLEKWGTHYKAMKINIWCNFFYKIPKNVKPFDCSWKGITQQLCLFVCFVSNYGQLFGNGGFQWKIQTPVSCLVTWRQCTRTGWVAYVLSLVRNGAASGKHKFNCWSKILQTSYF